MKNEKRVFKNRLPVILCSLCFILSGCSEKSDTTVGDSKPDKSINSNKKEYDSESDDGKPHEVSQETSDSDESELPYEWVIEPSVKADDIIVSDLELSNDEKYSNYLAAEEAAVIEVNGKYGIISYDGTYIAEPEYSNHSFLDVMTASQMIEVSDEELGSVQVFNGEYDIDIQHDAPHGWGYMSYSYYAVDGIEDVISLWEASSYVDNAMQGSFLKNNTSDGRLFAVVQKADGYVDDDGIPWIKEDSEKNIFGIGSIDGVVVPCQYTGGISPCSTSLTVGALEKDGKWGYFNSEGEQIIDFVCEPIIFPITQKSSDYEWVTFDSTAYQIFYTGKGIPYNATENLIAVKTDAGYGYFDIEGNEVISPGTFAETRPFHNGKAWVKDTESDLWGVIQLTGSKEETEETPEVHYLGANFNNLKFGGLIAENKDSVVYLTYDEASVFDADSYDNYRQIYTGQVWKYDKSSGTTSVVSGGEGWDSIWSASQSSYPVENINVAEDGTIYLSSYSADSDSTDIFSIDSKTGNFLKITTVSHKIHDMIFIDNTLYYSTNYGIISYSISKHKPKIMLKTDDYICNPNLVNFYDNTLYYTYVKLSDTENYSTFLAGYNLNNSETETICLNDLVDLKDKPIFWTNVYPTHDGIVSFEHDYIGKYSFVSKDVQIYDNPYRTLPDSFPPDPKGFIELDNAYFTYTGNLSESYSDAYHIVKVSENFEVAKDFKGIFSIFEASDGSTFMERNFTFGYADNGIWVASDNIVRRYSSDGENTTVYIK